MDVDGLEFLASRIAPSPRLRIRGGTWDGANFRPAESPGEALPAELACLPPQPGGFVYAAHVDGETPIVLGPAASTEARLAQLEARLARLPYRVAHGQWVEPDPGPTSSFIRFPPGALFTAPPTVVTQLASPAGVYSGARALVSAVGTTGFQLSTVGTATARCPWNWIAIQ